MSVAAAAGIVLLKDDSSRKVMSRRKKNLRRFGMSVLNDIISANQREKELYLSTGL